ncbi:MULTISPECIES: twin-arginine translocase TatA/TatE family subunit [Deinococcus]|jgi:sec-independent protein translocase protein TatA|uniref:Sec-independent protein translocase protein TatA n=2 Tax=Deinococcus TaxID=1298 RepID=A0ABQ2RWK9_9DEIO|nr:MULTISPECIES: twin-arginine translocase TatA/TatE family subunit [Deinococcus]MBX8466747.1 twin-arginine translocase TatA/TatE family subunit [Deinococcus sp. RIT780]MCD0162746.1 twin-arginine translocase TatA/TatE family subunit [Deinococcus sp. 6YEL10]MCD0166483.1 twin-arginine translocase TatA/TatE family subunit [Deinococcus sp. 12RED42]MCD0170812.1 twin-arginine translocase TatA/TatE family subunit [Deinococcus sp. 23YEL01]MCD0176978.1 twin-arginine translocase TatA/TatE family subunit
MGPLEIILIVVVIALIFGARKLPELGKGLGQGIKEFKKETHEPVVPVTDVASRQLDPVTGAPIVTEQAAPVTERRN